MTPGRARLAAAGGAAVLVVPIAGTAWLAFERGGFFAGETAVAAAVACGLLLAWTVLSGRPAAGLGRAGAAALAALLALCAWTLLSSTWGDAVARATYEFDRALLYAAVFALLAARPGGTVGARWLIRGFALALCAACVAGLLVHLLPGTFGRPPGIPPSDRLSWPIGYWNGIGLAAAMALVMCLHLTSDLREHVAVRVLSAGAMPAIAATLYLTLSRGGMLGAAIGLALVVALGRSRGLAGGLLATAPAAALAVAAAAGADVLTDGYDPAARATLDAGRDLALHLAFVCGGAAIARGVLVLLDRRLAALRAPRPWSPRRRAAVGALTVCAVAAAVAATGVTGAAASEWKEFRSSEPVASSGSGRLLETSANGRIEHWEAAWDAWQREPVHGVGAGTYAHEWALQRPLDFAVQDGHSLYLETLGELGLVGIALVLVAFLLPLAAAMRRRRADRVTWSAVVAVATLWLVCAGVDWHWEEPAVTLPVVALLACACARDAPRPARSHRRSRLARAAVALALVLLAVTPVRVALSQRAVDDALAAFRAGDCTTAIERALDAQAAFGARPDAYELAGFCDTRVGAHALAERMLLAAVNRDPRSWELHYGLGLVRGAAGEDPRPALRAALQRSPREALVRDALRRMRERDPAVWRREAAASRLVIPAAVQP